jgi:glucose-6-phosphate 1-dehydrogenase
MDADDIRTEKAKILKSLRPCAEGEQPEVAVVRGQYQGYRQEPGVAADSQTETFIAVRALIDTWRWGKVPFYLRTGKRLASRFSSIRIQFAMPPHNLFGSYAECHLRPNAIHLRLQPTEGIDLHFEAKKPGPGMKMQPVRMHFDYPEAFETSSAEAYQRLLSDVASGDQGLFIRSDEVELSWRFADSVRSAMAQTPLHSYAPGSMGPENQHSLFGPCEGRWTND